MATMMKTKGVEADEAPKHRIRITLTSRSVKDLESGKLRMCFVRRKLCMIFFSCYSLHLFEAQG